MFFICSDLFLLDSYLRLLNFIFLSIVLSSLITLIAFFFKPITEEDSEKLAVYECGFEPFESSRISLDIHFFLICILFLIFDIEILIILP